MVSEARRLKIALKRKARNKERNARAAAIAEKTVQEQRFHRQRPSTSSSSSLSPSSDKENRNIDKRQLMAVARKQAREELKTEKRTKKLQQQHPAVAKPSVFLQLPAEVRSRIYGFILADRKLAITADSGDEDALFHNVRRQTGPLRNHYALTAVCRLIRIEVLPLVPPIWDLKIEWYGKGRFGAIAFRQWCRRGGEERMSQIRNLRLHSEDMCGHRELNGGTGAPLRCVRYAHIWAEGPPVPGVAPVWKRAFNGCSNGSEECGKVRARNIEKALVAASTHHSSPDRPWQMLCGQIYAALGETSWLRLGLTWFW